MSIRVVNLRNYVKRENEELVKIDRSSVFGNPFYMKNEREKEKTRHVGRPNMYCEKEERGGCRAIRPVAFTPVCVFFFYVHCI